MLPLVGPQYRRFLESWQKATPIQQGPIASTYNNPVNANTITPTQPMIPPANAPVVTTSPVQTYPTAPTVIEQSSPVLTPPSPPSPLLNGTPPSTGALQIDDRTRSMPPGTFPPNAMTTPVMPDLPDNKPSIPSPQPPSPQVAGPNIPGATRVESSPMPLLLAPQPPMSQQNTAGTIPAQSTIIMPEIAAPVISKPLEPSLPKATMPGKNNTLNPGTTPPPLPPPPSIPVFDGRDRN
ncbi:MAG: hypothetical protein QM703_21675 [Gemmatales bacterium]